MINEERKIDPYATTHNLKLERSINIIDSEGAKSDVKDIVLLAPKGKHTNLLDDFSTAQEAGRSIGFIRDFIIKNEMAVVKTTNKPLTQLNFDNMSLVQSSKIVMEYMDVFLVQGVMAVVS